LIRPIVVISRCIDFDSCRYNGQVIRASLRDELEPFVELRPICPELEIGLGVPRDPVRLVGREGGPHMVQRSTGRDLTVAMNAFSARFLDSLDEVDGFILKSRSPSCAIRDGKVFRSDAEDAGHDSGPGLFAAQVLERFPATAVEDEGRLGDERLRQHFLTRLFTLASFRLAVADGGRHGLEAFHTANKLLLMAYDEARLRLLGRLVASAPDRLSCELVAEYRSGLAAALARPARPGSNVNVLMHALGHLEKANSTDQLNPGERWHFLWMLDEYRARRLPLSAPQGVLGSWAARFEVEDLKRQSFFAPYPLDLVRASLQTPPGGVKPRGAVIPSR
jgi:uncharacterized protein YbgA (DUF1722 family)/uncharacterized protein YbbK (DUF523 family)